MFQTDLWRHGIRYSGPVTKVTKRYVTLTGVGIRGQTRFKIRDETELWDGFNSWTLRTDAL